MSIYVTPNWASTTTYAKNEFVRQPANSTDFYYSLTNDNLNNQPSTTSTSWDGLGTFNGLTYPRFFWKPSYQSTVNHQPRVVTIKFEDGYSQRIPQVINSDLLQFDLTFDLRDSQEAEAINHFLHFRKGSKAFLWTPFAPYNEQRLFICSTWNTTFQFYNNYTVRAQFDEVAS